MTQQFSRTVSMMTQQFWTGVRGQARGKACCLPLNSLKDDQLLSLCVCVCVFASCLVLLLHMLGCRDNTASQTGGGRLRCSPSFPWMLESLLGCEISSDKQPAVHVSFTRSQRTHPRVQLCPGVSRRVQVCPGVSRRVQACPGVSRRFQLCPGVIS